MSAVKTNSAVKFLPTNADNYDRLEHIIYYNK